VRTPLVVVVAEVADHHLRLEERVEDLAIQEVVAQLAVEALHFYEIETFPENDRTRFAISPNARQGVLKRLLIENRVRAEAEEMSKPKRGKRNRAAPADQPTLFDETG
jgi:hypothetical protein